MGHFFARTEETIQIRQQDQEYISFQITRYFTPVFAIIRRLLEKLNRKEE
nr:MAG TPA: hypothetical protein [Caudoviricetes sp.]